MNAKLTTPLELSLHLIDEDPNQPRKADNPGFSAESLGELAATIRDRGVKSPISVRKHPTDKGRYIINHGARRFRASQLAKRTTIPAFIDNDYSEIDQVIENLQRNELTAREIADFIGRELANGKKRTDIARELGKSGAFITQHANLLDLPEPIAAAFSSGRARDVTVVNELLTAYKKNKEAVTLWLSDETQDLTRSSVKLLREYLAERGQREVDAEEHTGVGGDYEHGMGIPSETIHFSERTATERPHPTVALRKETPVKIIVKHGRRLAQLLIDRSDRTSATAWVKYQDNGDEALIELKELRLIQLT